MLDWASQHASGRRVWALEGTGSFAAGLADALAEAGEDVAGAGALKRSRGAKNDRPGAVRAARSAMARDHQASPRARGLAWWSRAIALRAARTAPGRSFLAPRLRLRAPAPATSSPASASASASPAAKLPVPSSAQTRRPDACWLAQSSIWPYPAPSAGAA